MVYQGTGGPPPSEQRRSGKLPSGQKPLGFHLYEALPNGKTKKVSLFRVKPGEKNVPFLFLDEALPETGSAPSVRVHQDIKYNGTYGNITLCNSHHPAGCPLDLVFQKENKFSGKVEPARGAWRWVATGIKMQSFTFTKGKLAGKSVPYQRCLLLVPDFENQYDNFMALREQYAEKGGLRGRIFNVRRSEEQRSSKIGTLWTPIDYMTDEQMLERFEDAAGDYGLPVEKYIAPMDYAHVLRELSDEEAANAARWIAGDMGLDLDKLSGKVPAEVQIAEGSESSDSEDDEIPY